MSLRLFKVDAVDGGWVHEIIEPLEQDDTTLEFNGNTLGYKRTILEYDGRDL